MTAKPRTNAEAWETDKTPEKGVGPSDGSSVRIIRKVPHPGTLKANSDPASAAPDSDPKSPSLPGDDAVSHDAGSLPSDMAGGAFGTMLGPVLQRMCNGRLSEIVWFRTDWQRGGAVTGYANWTDDDGVAQPVVVKMPVPPCERHWMVTLSSTDVCPIVYAHGEAVGGYDLAWIVMERLPHGPLGGAWGAAAFDLLIDAVGRFYEAAESHPRQGEPVHKDWNAILDKAREAVRANALPDEQRWGKALKRAHRKLKEWIKVWGDRPTDHWCHGDLHLGNAMTRDAPPQGPAMLFDFAHTRVGHWAEDAVYFEHLYWARRDKLDGRKLCKAIAHERKRRGLEMDKDWARFAEVKRALLAMSTPAMLEFDGDRAHVAAALEVLEREAG